MGNTSSNASRKVTAQDKAILDLKIQRDKLHQYQKKITVITRRETEIAKHHLSLGDKQRALLALRRKKYQESLLSKTDSQLAQLEKLTADVEFALVQKDVYFGLQQGTAVLKEIHKEMGGVEAVEKLMGESEEEKAFQKEVSEMLEGRMTLQDEEDVEKELAALERETADVKADQKLPDAPEITPLPSAPNTDVEVGREATNAREEETRQALAA